MKMKLFVKKIFWFIIIFILFWLMILPIHYFVLGNQYANEYTGIFTVKMDRLMSIDEPKLILVGDSNIAFGISSEMLEEQFGMPVVNLGLHGGLGEYFHWMMAKNGVNEGDIIIYAGAFPFDNKAIPDGRLAWVTMEFHTEYYNVLSKENYLKMLVYYPVYFVNSLNKYISGQGSSCVSAKELGFNEWGDVCEYRPNNEDNQFFEKDYISMPKLETRISKQILNEINEYCESKGATFLIAGYPIGIDGEITDGQYEELCGYRNKLQSGLNCKVISNYEDYLIDYKYFHNTWLHLSSEGAVIRTEQLIQDLIDYGL